MILTFWQLIGLVSTGALIFYMGLRAGSFKQRRFADAYLQYKKAVDEQFQQFSESLATVVIAKIAEEMRAKDAKPEESK